MIVHRPVGGVGQRPSRLSATHPVASGVTILSGQLITLVENTTDAQLEWTIGYDSGAEGARPYTFYFAVDDSADGDVLAAGNLQGLSVNGDYELSTAHYKSGETYKAGDPLTFDGVTGDLKKATLATDLVLARIVKDFAAPVDLSAGYVSGTLEPTAGGVITPGVQGGTFLYGKHTNATDLTMIRFETVHPYLLGASS